MGYSDERLGDIFDKTDGQCHICGKKLAFKNYAANGSRGAWEVEHSIPKAKGGTDHLNNLFPACISCNRSKRDGSTRAARAQYGRKRAPLSQERKDRVRSKNTVKGGIVGAGLGSFLGPGGAIVGGFLGALIGHGQDPDPDPE